MGKFFAYCYFIGDAEQRRQFFAEVHHIVVLTQAFGILSWLLAAGLLFGPQGRGDAALWYGLPGMAVCLLLTVRACSLPQLIVSGALGALSTAWAYRLFLHATEQPQLWVLPIGMAIALAAAPVFSGLVNYLLTAGGAWLILALGHFPGQPGQLDFQLAAVAVGGSLCIGSYLNMYFLSLRVRNYNARQELSALAFKDGVTGLPNRRKFTLDVHLAQQQAHTALYFLMIDIDDFKMINDTLGHDVGDEVLQRTGAVIARLAAGQPCGRLGGEEFGMLVEGTLADAERLAGHLLQAVQAACEPSRTVSIGIAALDRQADLAVSYRAADQALYAAKRAGKNCYRVATALRAAA